ncbi:MAG: S-layer protein, partial [Acidaminococcus sp.]|nr:S-layer protein [Acidaminococcus sp.]
MKKRQLSAALTCAILLSLNCQGAWAADTAAGSGNGVAIGTGSNAPKAENVAIGKGATISYSNGASNATGDIVIGSKAHTNNYVSQGGGIAIGENAFS